MIHLSSTFFSRIHDSKHKYTKYVFMCTQSIWSRQLQEQQNDCLIRMGNLKFTCTKQQLRQGYLPANSQVQRSEESDPSESFCKLATVTQIGCKQEPKLT